MVRFFYAVMEAIGAFLDAWRTYGRTIPQTATIAVGTPVRVRHSDSRYEGTWVVRGFEDTERGRIYTLTRPEHDTLKGQKLFGLRREDLEIVPYDSARGRR